MLTASQMRFVFSTTLPPERRCTMQTFPATTPLLPYMTSAPTTRRQALALVHGPPPGARSAERWFYESTEAGQTVLAAQAALRNAGVPFAVWFYMGPGYAAAPERPSTRLRRDGEPRQ